MKCPVSSETIFAHLHLLQYASRPENGHLHSSPPAPVTILRRWGSIRRQSSASKACEMAVLTICKRCHSCIDSRIISHSLLMDTQVLLMPGWCASPWVPHHLLQLLLLVLVLSSLARTISHLASVCVCGRCAANADVMLHSSALSDPAPRRHQIGGQPSDAGECGGAGVHLNKSKKHENQNCSSLQLHICRA